MRSLVYVLLAAGLVGCPPEDPEFDHPIQPTSGRIVGGSSGGDNGGGGGNNGGGNVPTNDAGVGLGDGGFTGLDGGPFVQDAGPFLDAFDVPPDAPEPSNPTDQIP